MIQVLKACVQLRQLMIGGTLASMLGIYTNIPLTISRYHDYSLHNTPTKPMPSSDSMLKLSGLFFACHKRKSPHTSFNAPTRRESLFDELFQGLAA